MQISCPSCKEALVVAEEALRKGVVKVRCGHCSFAFVIRLGDPGAGKMETQQTPSESVPVVGLKSSGATAQTAGEIGTAPARFIAADTQTSIYVDPDFQKEISSVDTTAEEEIKTVKIDQEELALAIGEVALSDEETAVVPGWAGEAIEPRVTAAKTASREPTLRDFPAPPPGAPSAAAPPPPTSETPAALDGPVAAGTLAAVDVAGAVAAPHAVATADVAAATDIPRVYPVFSGAQAALSPEQAEEPAPGQPEAAVAQGEMSEQPEPFSAEAGPASPPAPMDTVTPTASDAGAGSPAVTRPVSQPAPAASAQSDQAQPGQVPAAPPPVHGPAVPAAPIASGAAVPSSLAQVLAIASSPASTMTPPPMAPWSAPGSYPAAPPQTPPPFHGSPTAPQVASVPGRIAGAGRGPMMLDLDSALAGLDLDQQPAGQGMRIAGVVMTALASLVTLFFLFVLGRNEWSLDMGRFDEMVARAFGGAKSGQEETNELRGLEASEPIMEEGMLSSGERVLLVKGMVKNNDTRPRKYIYVRVTLQRHGRNVVSAEAPAGNIFSAEQIKGLTKNRLLAQISPAGRDGSNARVSDGQSVGYMVVLTNLPLDYSPSRYGSVAEVSQAEVTK